MQKCAELLRILGSAVVLACKHAICLACMADWLSSSATKDCPACRASVAPALAEVVLQHHHDHRHD